MESIPNTIDTIHDTPIAELLRSPAIITSNKRSEETWGFWIWRKNEQNELGLSCNNFSFSDDEITQLLNGGTVTRDPGGENVQIKIGPPNPDYQVPETQHPIGAAVTDDQGNTHFITGIGNGFRHMRDGIPLYSSETLLAYSLNEFPLPVPEFEMHFRKLAMHYSIIEDPAIQQKFSSATGGITKGLYSMANVADADTLTQLSDQELTAHIAQTRQKLEAQLSAL